MNFVALLTLFMLKYIVDLHIAVTLTFVVRDRYLNIEIDGREAVTIETITWNISTEYVNMYYNSIKR